MSDTTPMEQAKRLYDYEPTTELPVITYERKRMGWPSAFLAAVIIIDLTAFNA